MCYLQRSPTLLFGMDTMMNILLLYLMIAPGGAALSVDNWLRRRRERSEGLGDRPSPPLITATLATRLLQINFCFIYLGSGSSKLLGAAWWNGTAIWGTVANSYFAPINQAWYAAILQFLSQNRLLWELSMSAGCLFTLFVEIGFPFLVWSRKWRWWMVSCSVLLHTGIGVCMGLTTFSLCMLCMVMAFVPPEAVRELIDRALAVWRRSGEFDRSARERPGALVPAGQR
jgi:Vitamin K-dependent gamma-carboxylase